MQPQASAASPPSAQSQVHWGTWLFSARADLLVVTLPLLLAAGAAGTAAVLGQEVGAQAGRLASWTAQNVLGNATHVALTFLLFAVHRDVPTAAPGQPRLLLAGGLAMLGVAGLLFALSLVDRLAYAHVVLVVFNVFGLHHTLAQHRGFWALHTLRAQHAGLAPPAPLERRLQLAYVPLLLTLVLTRLFFVAEGPGPHAPPFLDVGQGALLPHGTLALLLAVWLGFFALLFRTLLRAGRTSGPKLLYLAAVAGGTWLVLVAPTWGSVVLPGMHGLEYYLLSARMLEPRAGDTPGGRTRRPLWPLMVLAMLPLFVLGLVHGLLPSGGTAAPVAPTAAGGGTLLLRALTCLSLGVVLAHYFADALIYRLRLPGVRRVMLRRLGLAT